MADSKIHTYAEELQKEIELLCADFQTTLSDPVLQSAATKLKHRAKEYLSPSFLVLIVGPVKSGKSTLVNLIAGDHISPTDFLECTVRPSLISSTDGEYTINVFRSSAPNIDTVKADQIDQMFDYVNGLIGENDIQSMHKQTLPLTPENIERYVALELIRVPTDSIILTSIETKGGILLRDNVYVIDMPGFDGAHVNLGSEGYRRIVERADLVIFVQSSNSAISKVSTDFFDLLKQKNGDVPVCLVQNVFKSAFWRDEAKINEDMDRQREYAIGVIEEAGLKIEPDYAFNVNLGEVSDFRDRNFREEFEDELKAECDEFDRIQQKMYDLVVDGRESIRVRNCISRTALAKQRLQDIVMQEITECNNANTKAQEIIKNFSAAKKKVDDLKKLKLHDSIDYNGIIEKIVEKYNAYKNLYCPVDNELIFSYDTNQARHIISEFITDISGICATAFTAAASAFYNNLMNNQEIFNWEHEISNLFGTHGINAPEFRRTSQNLPEPPEIKMPDINLNTLVKRKMIRKHSKTEMLAYLGYVVNQVVTFGSPTPTSTFLTTSVAPVYDSALDELAKVCLDNAVARVNSIIDEGCAKAIAMIIPDMNEFQNRMERLDALHARLKQLSIKLP